MAGIARWRARVGEEKANAKSARATGRGTKYHSIAEDYFNNNLDLKKYKKFPLPVLMFHHSRSTLDRINNIYLQEAALYSKHLELAGRVDCIAEFDGVLSIIDFKTAEEPKREEYLYDYFVQETAYACMLQENYGLTVKQLVTIVACENGETQVKVLPPKKEFFMKLMSYIDEYQERYGQKTIIRG
jgi:genome maintenance exonuclease 1